MARIDEIKERLAAITPGAWITGYIETEYEERQIVSTGTDRVVAYAYCPSDEQQRDKNAAFIAAAPEDIRYLMEQVELFQGAIGSLIELAGDVDIPVVQRAKELLDASD